MFPLYQSPPPATTNMQSAFGFGYPQFPEWNPNNFPEASTNPPPFPYFFQFFQKFPQDAYKPRRSSDLAQYSYLFRNLDLATQFQEFISAQTLPQHEFNLRWRVILDLLQILREHHPKCEIYAFGSIITGLGDFTSDIDLFVDLYGTANTKFKIIHSRDALEMVRRLLRISLCCQTRRPLVKHLIPVTSARVPILKLTHSVTDISCDLSFENRLPVQNTKLVCLYFKLDPRIFPLIVIIRYWAKFHKLLGSTDIKKYALNLMVIVFLVQKGIIPSVLFLQNLRAEERQSLGQLTNHDEIEGWDASFCENVELINTRFRDVNNPIPPPDCSVNAIISLAVEFFDFYANVDLGSSVICTLLGTIMPRQAFNPGNEEDLPQPLIRYKIWAMRQEINRRLHITAYFCLQDPFLLSFNVGAVAPLGTLLRFQIACAMTSISFKSQKLQVTSILDLFVPLADHVGGSKFIEEYKSRLKCEATRKQIKTAFGDELNLELEENNSPFLKLPSNLSYLEGLLTERNVEAAIMKKHRWESLLDLELDSAFESTFLTEIVGGGFHLSHSQMKNRMRVLWKDFTLAFLDDIFTQGLKLGLTRSDVSQEGCGEEVETILRKEWRRKKWDLRTLEQEKDDHLNPPLKLKEESNNLLRKLMALPPFPSTKTDYIKFQLVLRHPIWEERTSSMLKQVFEDMPPSEKFHVELQQSNEEETRDKEKRNVRVDCIINPIYIEEQVSKMIIREGWEDKINSCLPITFNILAKLDVSSSEEVLPCVQFVFEKNPNQVCSTDVYNQVLNIMSKIVSEGFPCYQIYRLVKFLDLSTVDVGDQQKYTRVDVDEGVEQEASGGNEPNLELEGKEETTCLSSLPPSSLSTSAISSATADEVPEIGKCSISEGEDALSGRGQVEKIVQVEVGANETASGFCSDSDDEHVESNGQDDLLRLPSSSSLSTSTISSKDGVSD